MEKKNEILVSFCIPSYNRAKMTWMLAASILKYEGEDIEVIVAEDGSTDDTVEILSRIEDPRFRLIVNEKNLGGAGNMAGSLRFSRGKYSFVAFSREDIRGERIGELLDFLRRGEYSLVYCCEDRQDRDDEIFRPGVRTACEFGYAWSHPTGLIFRTEELSPILEQIRPEEASEKYLYFPHDFWMTELCLFGNYRIVRYNKVIRVRVKEDYVRNSVSANVDYDKDPWFYPKGRLEQFEKYMSHLDRQPIDDRAKGAIFFSAYERTLSFSTIGYRDQAADENTCIHWRTQIHHVSLSEMFRAARTVSERALEIQKMYGYKVEATAALRMRLPVTETLLRVIKKAIRKRVGK